MTTTALPLFTAAEATGQTALLDVAGELAAPLAPAVDVELALIGDPRDFERTPTRPAEPTLALVDEPLALFPAATTRPAFRGQMTALDELGLIPGDTAPAPAGPTYTIAKPRELTLDMTDAELAAEYAATGFDNPEYRELSDLVAYRQGTAAQRRTASATLRAAARRRAIIARMARARGLDLLAH